MARGINVDKPYWEDGGHNNFVDEEEETEKEKDEPTLKLHRVENTSITNQAIEIEVAKVDVVLKKRLRNQNDDDEWSGMSPSKRHSPEKKEEKKE